MNSFNSKEIIKIDNATDEARRFIGRANRWKNRIKKGDDNEKIKETQSQ